jgi:hypothetical protein
MQLDRAEIHDVIMRYAAGVDRRDFELVRACFTPDVTGWSHDRESMIEYITGIRTFEVSMHMMGNQLIEVHGDEASLHNYAMLAQRRPGYYGGTYELNSTKHRYEERLVRRDRWVISRRAAEELDPVVGVTEMQTVDSAVQLLLDRAEIHDLIMRYAMHVDRRDWDAAGSCLASSFEVRAGPTVFDDPDKLFEHLRASGEHFSSTNHFLGTQHIEVGGDRATSRSLALITLRDHSDPPGEMTAPGYVYVDELVRQNGRWKLAGRNRDGADGTSRTITQVTMTSNDPVVQWLLDRAAIDDLIAACALAVDRRDFDLVERCFLPDAEITLGTGVVHLAVGYGNLLALEVGQWHSTAHSVGNQLMELGRNEADVDTYLYFTSKPTADAPPTPWAHGARRFVDRVVRTSDGWRIAARSCTDNTVRGERLPSYVSGWKYPAAASL